MSAEPVARPPKLLDRVRHACRVRHYSIRTEEAYHDWAKRFILFHHKRHPQEMGAAEIAQFLTHLAVEGQVSPSTQNQAFSALLFLYRDVLQTVGARVEFASPAVAHPDAASLVELAVPRFLREEHDQLFDVVPMYLRKSDAEIAWDDRARGGKP